MSKSGQAQKFDAFRETTPKDLVPRGKLTFYRKPSAFTVLGAANQTGLKICLLHKFSWDCFAEGFCSGSETHFPEKEGSRWGRVRKNRQMLELLACSCLHTLNRFKGVRRTPQRGKLEQHLKGEKTRCCTRVNEPKPRPRSRLSQIKLRIVIKLLIFGQLMGILTTEGDFHGS